MNGKEQRRAMILTAVVEGRLSAPEGAELMGLSARHERRLRHAFVRGGPAALVHGNRGRKPIHTLDAGVRERVVALAEGNYAGCNDQHLSELLAEREGITLSRSSVRRIRREAGLRSPRRRRAPRHRARRERMPQAGMLLQVDGSRHQWLGPEGPWLTLIGAIDDATGEVPFALFREHEDAQGYLLLLREVARKRGVPLALYSDRHTIFQSGTKEPLSIEEELAGKPLPTQVRRALDELGISWIGARSPQAKGRIERLWGTFQDRLCLGATARRCQHAGRGQRCPSRSPGAAQRAFPSATFRARFCLPPLPGRQTPCGRLLLPLLAERKQGQRRHSGGQSHPHPARTTAPLLRPRPSRDPRAPGRQCFGALPGRLHRPPGSSARPDGPSGRSSHQEPRQGRGTAPTARPEHR